MADPLLSVPGLGGYLAQRQRNEQLPMQELQQATQAMGLMGALRKAVVDQQYRQELAALGPTPTQEQLVGVAARYGGPEAVMKAQQASLDRQAQITSQQQIAADRLTQNARFNEMMHEYRMSNAKTAEERAAEVARHNQVMEGIQKQLADMKGAKVSVTVPPAVTTTEVIDPSDPTRMLRVDARTYRGGSLNAPGVIGVSGRLSDREKLEAKRQFNMQGIGAVIQQAEELLTGKDGQLPTQSGIGTAIDFAGSLVGMTPPGAPEADKLRAIGGALTSKMPRMEGPQSDKDVALYKEMAAQIGNSQLPVARRRAALETVKGLWAKYEKLNPDAFAAPASPAAPSPAPSGFPTPQEIEAEIQRRRGGR